MTNDSINAITLESFIAVVAKVLVILIPMVAGSIFGANQASSRLYPNSGDLKFKDVTAIAGIKTDK